MLPSITITGLSTFVVSISMKFWCRMYSRNCDCVVTLILSSLQLQDGTQHINIEIFGCMAMLNLKWSDLNPSEFETLCDKLLTKEGFQNVKLYGGTGDRGRDI